MAIRPLLDLTDLPTAPGPFLSVRLTTEGAVANAGPRSHLRWWGLRDELLRRGAPEQLVEIVDAHVPGAHRFGRTLHVVVTADGSAFADHATTAEADLAVGRYESLPWLLPVLATRQREVPHVIVLTDRRGADITAVRRGAALLEDLEASEEPLTRQHKGGWADLNERRYQRRAENSWERNAGEVAVEVERLARWAGAERILVAGDVRAVQFLRDDLPGDLATLVRTVGGERWNADGSGGAHVDVAAALADLAALRTAELLERFEEERGQGDRAAAGADDVAGALAAGQVETLLVADVDDGLEAWFGDDPHAIAATAAGASVLGFEARTGRLREALARAALGTGAEVRVVDADAGPAEGIGALLRWA
ncbi:MAG: Vms1/Ankzf1 family peptidyl-tRNA hydrolase [Actinomycetota bacterium]